MTTKIAISEMPLNILIHKMAYPLQKNEADRQQLLFHATLF
jgi:hypothetical protein